MRALPFQVDLVFDRNRLFFSGESFSGEVVIRVGPQGVYVCDKLEIELVGAVHWTTTETCTTTNSDGTTSTHTRTVHHESAFLRMDRVLIRLGRGERIQFNPTTGERACRFPFSFELPKALYPSVDGDPGVKYRIVCSHSSSILAGYRTKEHFRVGGMVHPEKLLCAHEGMRISMTKTPFLGDAGSVLFDCLFRRSVVARGEKVAVAIRIDNSTRQKITQVVFVFARATDVFVPIECNAGTGASVETIIEIPRQAVAGFNDPISRQHFTSLTIRLSVENALRMDIRFPVEEVVILEGYPNEPTMQMRTEGGIEYPTVVEVLPSAPTLDVVAPVVEKYAPPIGPVPFVIWQPDNEVESCLCCTDKFITLLRRRHHCRLCGGVRCNSCTPKTVLNSLGRAPARVCKRCVSESAVYKMENAK